MQHLFVNPVHRRPKSGAVLFTTCCRLHCQSGGLISGAVLCRVITIFNLPGQVAQVRLGEILSLTTSHGLTGTITITPFGERVKDPVNHGGLRRQRCCWCPRVCRHHCLPHEADKCCCCALVHLSIVFSYGEFFFSGLSSAEPRQALI